MPIAGISQGLGLGGGTSATSSGAPSGGGAAPYSNAVSIELDGADDNATLASTFTLSGNKSFTGWFYFDSVSTRSIFAPIGAAHWSVSGFFITNASNVRFQTAAGRQTFTISNLSTGTWTHLAVTGDGTDLILYVNGSQAGSTLTDGDWSIGDFFKTATYYYFDGKADELALCYFDSREDIFFNEETAVKKITPNQDEVLQLLVYPKGLLPGSQEPRPLVKGCWRTFGFTTECSLRFGKRFAAQ